MKEDLLYSGALFAGSVFFAIDSFSAEDWGRFISCLFVMPIAVLWLAATIYQTLHPEQND